MKKYIVFIGVFVFCSLIFCGCFKEEKKPSDMDLIKEKGYITVGVRNDAYPFGYKNSKNERCGLDIEIAQEIAKQIFNAYDYGIIRYVDVSARDRISKLNSKEIDILVSTMSVNEKRKLVIDCSTPYFVTSQKIMVRGDSKISHLNYFNKKGRICVVLGTTGEKIIRLMAPNAYVVGAKNYREAFEYLKTGAVDAILGDDCILKGIINLNDKEKNNYKIIGRSYSNEYYAVALRKSPESKELLEAVNAAIVEILDSKKINIIKSHYKL